MNLKYSLSPKHCFNCLIATYENCPTSNRSTLFWKDCSFMMQPLYNNSTQRYLSQTITFSIFNCFMTAFMCAFKIIIYLPFVMFFNKTVIIANESQISQMGISSSVCMTVFQKDDTHHIHILCHYKPIVYYTITRYFK